MTFCQKCGSPVENGSGFCTECGTAVSAAVPTPPQPTFRQPTFQQPSPPPYYAPQPAYTAPVPTRNPGSTAKVFALLALVLAGAAILLEILGLIDSYKGIPQDRFADMFGSSLASMVMPTTVTVFVPLAALILARTQSTKAAKPFMIVAICVLGLQVLAAGYAFIQYCRIIDGADVGATYLYSLANSVKGSGILMDPYSFFMTLTRAGRINTFNLLYIVSSVLYILKNVFAILSLRKLSRS